MHITIPWPPRECSPNWRGHWATKAKAVKKYREAGWACTKRDKVAVTWDGDIDLSITFYPPDKRRRDWDNMLASCKPALDGIADALKVNDSRFRVSMQRSKETLGQVVVTVSPAF